MLIGRKGLFKCLWLHVPFLSTFPHLVHQIPPNTALLFILPDAIILRPFSILAVFQVFPDDSVAFQSSEYILDQIRDQK